jgi:hypothetical protein
MFDPAPIAASHRQLAELQRTLETKATQLEQLIVDLSGLVGADGTVPWGALTEPFGGAWEGVHRDRLRSLVDALGDQARRVGEHRRRATVGLDDLDDLDAAS